MGSDMYIGERTSLDGVKGWEHWAMLTSRLQSRACYEHALVGKLLWLAAGIVLALAVIPVVKPLIQPLSSDDWAYCAAHADVVANIWKTQHSELSFDPRTEAQNVAGYFRGDADATLFVAAATYQDPNDWGERPDISRVDDQLDPACLALTHP